MCSAQGVCPTHLTCHWHWHWSYLAIKIFAFQCAVSVSILSPCSGSWWGDPAVTHIVCYMTSSRVSHHPANNTIGMKLSAWPLTSQIFWVEERCLIKVCPSLEYHTSICGCARHGSVICRLCITIHVLLHYILVNLSRVWIGDCIRNYFAGCDHVSTSKISISDTKRT